MELQNLAIVVVVVSAVVWGTLQWLRRMAYQALNPRFRWTPLDPARGEGLDVTVEVECSQVVHVRSVEAHLIATRYSYPAPGSQDGSGLWLLDGNRPQGTPEKDICSHSRVILCHEIMFTPGDPMKLVGELDVPGDALPTHAIGRLQIHWSIQIRFQLANFPPLVLEQPVEIKREPTGRPAQYRAPVVDAAKPPPLLQDPPPVAYRPTVAPRADCAPDLELDIPPTAHSAKGTSGPPGRAEKPAPTASSEMFAHLELDVERQDPPPRSSKP